MFFLMMPNITKVKHCWKLDNWAICKTTLSEHHVMKHILAEFKAYGGIGRLYLLSEVSVMLSSSFRFAFITKFCFMK